jgi:hypothetical protein
MLDSDEARRVNLLEDDEESVTHWCKVWACTSRIERASEKLEYLVEGMKRSLALFPDRELVGDDVAKLCIRAALSESSVESMIEDCNDQDQFKIVSLLSSLDSVSALYFSGRCYLKGIGVRVDIVKAKEFFEAAIAAKPLHELVSAFKQGKTYEEEVGAAQKARLKLERVECALAVMGLLPQPIAEEIVENFE